jgi:uncharacterized membrane protein YeaQ/YmgE (transglycosylase-associated protein family)
MHWLYVIIIGALAGWLAGLVWKGSGFGLIGNIITGILGGMIGVWGAGKLGIMGSGFIFEILVSAGGALLLLLIFRLIRG